jgi:uncharacterized protein (DUF934 family)
MAKIIKNREIVEDSWKTLRLAANDTPATVKLPAGPVLVPLAVWLARKADLIHRQWEHGQAFGLWLGPKDNPADIAADIEDFELIAIEFPLASDGRGYSIATLLRTRYGYAGELRAFGAVGRDHIHTLHRVGFDAFDFAQPELAVAGLDDFSEAYQAAANQPQPLFRRRTAFA